MAHYQNILTGAIHEVTDNTMLEYEQTSWWVRLPEAPPAPPKPKAPAKAKAQPDK